MDGKSLSQHMESLDEEARRVGVRPLSEFFSVEPSQMAEFMEGEGLDASEIELPPLAQHSAVDGLATVRALATCPVAQNNGVARDLRRCEQILTVAANHGVGWHMEVDF
ncbi:MAG: hypothetical protein IT442_03285 [Phycisphaeraceae bacterium]|nr:hypothetical protein [Phycisphaeraceae bacterium]